MYPSFEISAKDIMPYAEYAQQRKKLRKKMIAYKKNRRVSIGPFATCYFESFRTMWHQIQEMLHIEKGGEKQLAEELEAYNPLVPKGNNLSCTLMFEIDNAHQRERTLSALIGIEKTFFLRFEGDEIVVEKSHLQDGERTVSVHFLSFIFTPQQIENFRHSKEIILGCRHQNYPHMSVLPLATKQSLLEDFHH